LISRIVTPLQGDTDFDLSRREIHEPAAPIKNERDRIGREYHAVIERDVLCLNSTIPVEIHLHAIRSSIQHFETGH
jgi:hypothetical protein